MDSTRTDRLLLAVAESRRKVALQTSKRSHNHSKQHSKTTFDVQNLKFALMRTVRHNINWQLISPFSYLRWCVRDSVAKPLPQFCKRQLFQATVSGAAGGASTLSFQPRRQNTRQALAPHHRGAEPFRSCLFPAASQGSSRLHPSHCVLECRTSSRQTQRLWECPIRKMVNLSCL